MTERLPAAGVYVHWPWCLSKCLYCDFNSHAAQPSSIDQERFRSALLAELDATLALHDPVCLGSVFFGGGTPSLIDPATVEALLNRLAQRVSLDSSLEVTLEANPGTISQAVLDAFKSAGVTRLSLGVQALNDPDLRLLGRRHSVPEALAAIELISKRFRRFSIDLIYGRPGQSPGEWEAELRQALDLGLGHLSLYQLTYEPQTPMGRAAAAGDITIHDADTEAEFYNLTLDLMADNGMPAYEISNFACHADWRCRHNLDIWRGGDYIGLGPGAHGRERRQGKVYNCARIADPAAWMRSAQGQEDGYITSDQISPADRATELLLLGLRLREGIDPALFEGLCGLPITKVINPARLSTLIEEGMLEWQEGRLRASRKAVPLLDSVIDFLIRE